MNPADEVLRARYGALKQDLQAQFAHDRQGYTRAKEAFFQEILPGRYVTE